MTLSAIGLTNGNIMVGDSSNIGADVAMSGDITITNAGVTTIKSSVALAGNPTTTTQSSGDNSTKIATTAFVQAAIAALGPVLTKSYTSSAQTITSAGSLTLAHGMGVAPALLTVLLTCTSAELGYSVGDVVIVASGPSNGSDSKQCAFVVDATNINVRYGSDGGAFRLTNKSNGNTGIITDSKWTMTLRAFG